MMALMLIPSYAYTMDFLVGSVRITLSTTRNSQSICRRITLIVDKHHVHGSRICTTMSTCRLGQMVLPDGTRPFGKMVEQSNQLPDETQRSICSRYTRESMNACTHRSDSRATVLRLGHRRSLLLVYGWSELGGLKLTEGHDEISC